MKPPEKSTMALATDRNGNLLSLEGKRWQTAQRPMQQKLDELSDLVNLLREKGLRSKVGLAFHLVDKAIITQAFFSFSRKLG